MELPEISDLFEGRYRLDAILGEGGFSRVYAATSVGVTREVAIKILKPEAGGYEPSLVARFLREARIMSQLRDQHTVTMYDCGRSTSGLLYMVCERLPGRDLDMVLQERGRLTESEAVTVLRQVLLSLHEAHTFGLLHRDIKPANIRIFEYMDEPLTVKVMDFGIAKGDDDAQVTMTGRIIGTPRYMAPEQLVGETLTPASDLYSVGLVAHEMLLGQHARIEMRPERLVPAHLVSPRLCRIVNQMLEQDIERRFQSAQDVLLALEELEVGAAAPPQPLTAPRRAGLAPTTLIEDAQSKTLPEQPRPQAAEFGVEQLRGWLGWFALLAVIGLCVAGFMILQGANDRLTNRQAFSRADRQFGGVEAPREIPLDVPVLPAEYAPARRPADVQVDRAPTVAARSAPAPDVVADDTVTASDRSRSSASCDVDFVGVGTKRFYDGLDKVGITAFVPRSYEPDTPGPTILLVDLESNRRAILGDPEMHALAERTGAVIVPVVLETIEESKFDEKHDEQAKFAFQVERAMYVAGKAFCVDEQQVFAIATRRTAYRLFEARCGLPLAGIVTTATGVIPTACPSQADTPHLHLHTRRDPGMSHKRSKKSSLRKCSWSSKPRAEIAETTRRRYMCGDQRPEQMSVDGCSLTRCARAAFATCDLDSGRIWQPGNPSPCNGPRPDDGEYALAIEAFMRAVADLE